MTKSPRRLRRQVQETVEEQVRDLPLHAVRLAMFGVGRALLLSDRLTRDYKEMREDGVTPVLHRLGKDAQHSASRAGEAVTRVVGRAVRGTPPAAPPEQPAAKPRTTATAGDTEISVGKPKPAEPETRPRSDDARAAAKHAAPEPADDAMPKPKPEPRHAKPEPEEVSAESLPVPDYDSATLPQLRARLRGLSAAQVALLRQYERAHAARPDVLRMYENRIAKLNGTT